MLAGDSLANNDAFAIEDRILHYVDKLNAAHIAQHGGQYKGFAEIRNGYAYVTAQDDQDLAGNGSITRAVEVVESAGTVHISAGTFVEQVIVDGKRVTLQGQGEQTVIKSPTGMLAGSFTAGGAVYRPVVMVTNSDQAVIRDLKVDGNDNGQNNGQFLGVGYYNASGTIENLDVVNVRISDSSGIQTGRAIYGRAEGDARQLNITNNRIANYQKNAIELHGSSLTAVVADNTMDGGGETSVIGRNGIVIRDGASGSVVSNTVSGHHFVDTASAQAMASGILLYYSGVVTIGGNILSGNEAAIATLDAPTGTSITGNQFRVDDQARNVVDIEINGGDVAIGSGNKFGGTFFLQNYSANDYDLTGYTSEEFDNLSNFEIENRIHHKMDDPALGLVMWVEKNVFVTTPGVESTDSDIQRAINLAASGWTINVEAGTYAGGINVNKAGVKLVGHGLPSVGLATVDHYPTGILINADDVTVDGFKITGAGEAGNQWHGIRIKGDNAVVANNTISGVFDGIATSGVTNNHQLAFNTITDVTGAGIRMQNGGSGAVIDANTVTNAAAGVVLDSVQNVTISRNTLDNNTWDGIGMDGNVSGTIIRNNFIRGNLEHGIFIASGTGPTTIVDNHIAGNGIGLQNSGSGVAMVAQSWWGSPTGPTGAVNSDPNALGDKVIGLAQVAPWLTDGTDKELDMPGFQPDESSTFAPIWNDEDEFYSTIADALAGTNAGGTIYIQSSHYAESITIDKQIKLIAMDGEEESGAVTVGSITLAGGADVSGSSGVTSADVTVQAGASVPQGILLASVGGTVTVEDGTYAGPIVVNKSITLKSRNLGGAVLNFSGQVSGLIVDADGVTIDGFKIAGNATTRFGVYIRGGAVGRTDVSIRNNEIYGVAGNIGSGYAIGILADANVGNASFGVNSGLEIIDNIIRNIGGGTVQGAGMSLQEVEGDIPGAGAVVKGNAIHSLHGAEATGIQVADSGIGYNNNPSSGVQIIDNDIDAPAGIVVYAEGNVISVIDVPPTVPLTGADSIDENQWYSLTIGPITDPGDNDVASISLIRIDWNGDGIYDQTLESGQLEELRDGNTVQLDHFYNDGPAGISKITVLVLNGDNTFTYNKPFTVNNLAPTASGFVATPNQVDAGTPGFVSFISPTDASPLDAASLRYAFDFNSDGIWDLGDGTSWALSAASTNPFADVPASFLSTPGTVTVTAVILDKDGGISAPFTTDIQVGEVSFRVLSMVPTASGFDITLNRAVDPSELNLYYAEGIDDTTPDVQLIGPNGQVSGSFVLNANGTGGSFIATGGVLPAGTYTVILESGATAFKDTNGQALDGNADGDVGDAYIDSFTVANPGSARIVSVPDFARGPGQAVNVPGGSSQGLPITISNASGVTGIRFSLRYDPSLLTITNITRAQALVAAGWNNPVFNEIEPGLIEVSVNGANALASTNVTALVQIEATVPNDARYGASQVLRLEDVRVFAGEAQLPSLADWGTNKVTYLGDTTGNRAFTGADVALVSRVDVALDTGFASALLTDPRIIADINGDGFVDAGDAGLLASEANYYQLPEVFGSYNQPAIPDSPAWVQPLETPGYDPTISLPQNVLAGLGKTVVASLHLDVEPEASINGFTTTIAYDPSQLQISEADITFDNVTMSGWSVSPALVDGFIALTFSRIDSVTDAAGTIADLAFTVKPDATSGATTLDVGGLANDGNATYTHVDGSILIDAEAPAVTDILVKGSGWSAAFLQYLKDQGLGDGGFSRVTGAGQLTALPWINIDQISIRFSEDVGASLGQDDLSLFGVDSTYAISGFAYDPLTYTATWTLGSAIGADKLLAAVAAAAVTDQAGNELDGEWTTGDTGNSGDGTPGGDFEFRFNVLPGDANRNGVANALDSNIVRSIQGAVPGIEAYSPFADVNGNAVINALDANIVRGLQGLTLPAGEPASPLALAATTFSGRSILDDLIDAEDEEELLLAV